MRIDELIEVLEVLDIRELDADAEVHMVTSDSREVRPGAVFVAIAGEKVDGHEFIADALRAGASLIVQSRPLEPDKLGGFVRVADSRSAYSQLCARIAGYPSQRLRVIGVTGTNGKTSTTLLIRHLLNFGGNRAAALGTLGLMRPDSESFEERGLTTPDAGKLQQLMRELVDEGATHLVMEVSSHALVQHRVDGIEFTAGVFTNLSQDHLDYHETMAQYREAKALLFLEHLTASGGYAVINADDEAGRNIAERFSGLKAIYGTNPKHNLVMRSIQASVNGVAWELVLKNGVWPDSLDLNVNLARLHSPLAAHYNAYNCTAAAGVALLEGLTLDEVTRGIASFSHVPGRLQRVPNSAGINVYVDYAHTPDALYNVLAALREVREPGSRIITVMGCGGDRDPDKRPKMGRAAQQGSDLLILTSDNPRSEQPQAILDMIEAGLDRSAAPFRREVDRRLAIKQAIREARPGDIVLIAGKGHEDYQIIGSQTIHFSDVEEAEASLAEFHGSWSPQNTR